MPTEQRLIDDALDYLCPDWGHHDEGEAVDDGRKRKHETGERGVSKVALHIVEKLPPDDINALLGSG